MGGAKSMDRQLIDENGVGHSDQIEGEFDTKSRVARNKNGNLKAAFEGDAAGKFSQGRTQQTDAGLEQTVFSGSGSALQDFAMSKPKPMVCSGQTKRIYKVNLDCQKD